MMSYSPLMAAAANSPMAYVINAAPTLTNVMTQALQQQQQQQQHQRKSVQSHSLHSQSSSSGHLNHHHQSHHLNGSGGGNGNNNGNGGGGNDNIGLSHRSSLGGDANEVYRLQEENQQLRSKINSRALENGKLRARIKDATVELDQYKKLLSDINHSMATGTDQEMIRAALASANLVLQHKSGGKGGAGTSGGDAIGGKGSGKGRRKASIDSNGSSNGNGMCDRCAAEAAEKPHLCDWIGCGKRFRQKAHLVAHRNIHTGTRYMCEWPGCGKAFYRKYNLAEHQKAHQAHNPNMCTFADCGKVFSTKYGLARHQQQQHSVLM